MEVQEVAMLLQIFLTQLRCEIVHWDESIPTDIVKKWIKVVETRIVKQIKVNHV